MINGEEFNVKRESKEYKYIMNFLNTNKCNLLDCLLENNLYESFKEILSDTNNSAILLNSLSIAKNIIDNELKGHNILRYLLANLNNRVIKNQFNIKNNNILSNKKLSNLFINQGASYFDKVPFSFNLLNHTNSYEKVAKCINPNLYYDSIFCRAIKSKSIKNQNVLVDIEDLNYENIRNYVESYNNFLDKKDVYKYEEQKIKFFDNKYLYITKEMDNLKSIINRFEYLAYRNNDDDIYNKMIKYVDEHPEILEEHKNILKNAFRDSNIFLLNGEAGSGKTEIICNYLTDFFKNRRILYVSNTHSVVNSLKKRVSDRFLNQDMDISFYTVKSIEKTKQQCDIVLFDECKSIGNKSMSKILQNINFKYGVFVGDTGQISAIELGNWFSVASEVLECYNLYGQHRTTNKDLKEIWNRIRNNDNLIIDDMKKLGFIKKISDDIYTKKDEDEIILCLNYNGLYGINDINTCFQNNNENKKYRLKEKIYKINDPIIFNENANNYSKIIYNNLKGIIRDIKEDNEYVKFYIEINEIIDEEMLEDKYNNIIKIHYKNIEKNSTIIEIIIKKKEADEDIEEDNNYIVPFNVSYATSIHKAQGLQYNSVKIIITPECEEVFDTEIFYTAISRAKNYLQIYVVNDNAIEKLKNMNYKNPLVDIKIFENSKKDVIEYEDKIILKNLETGKKEYFRIISGMKSYEFLSKGYRNEPNTYKTVIVQGSEPERRLISSETPIAQKLLGKHAGEIVKLIDNDMREYEYIIYRIIKTNNNINLDTYFIV